MGELWISRTPPPAPGHAPDHSGRLFLAGRLGILLLAAGAAALAFGTTGADRAGAAASGAAIAAPRDRYVCPMHPSARSATPGECPICRMALEPTDAGQAGRADGASTVRAPSAQYFDLVRRRGFGSDVRAPAWVESADVLSAIVYREDLAGLSVELHGVYTPTAAPEAAFAVELAAEPPAPWDRSTARVRFHIKEPAGKPPALLPGEVGWVRVAARRRALQVLPSAAILESAGGPYVLVPTAEGTLRKRPVEVGRVYGGSAIIQGGLRPHERVVTRDAFFLDAERRLQSESPAAGSP